MSSDDALTGVKRLLLDTAPVVYTVENHPFFFAPTDAVLRTALRRGVGIVVSSITLAEALSKPGASAREMEDSIEFCTASKGIEFRDILFDADFAIQVGHFRRMTGLKPPDCIQLASAEALDCDAILTNDRQFSRGPRRAIQVEDIEV